MTFLELLAVFGPPLLLSALASLAYWTDVMTGLQSYLVFGAPAVFLLLGALGYLLVHYSSKREP